MTQNWFKVLKLDQLHHLQFRTLYDQEESIQEWMNAVDEERKQKIYSERGMNPQNV